MSLPEPIVTAFSSVEREWDGITILQTHSTSLALASGWRPAVNAYRCADQFVVFVDAAGVSRKAIEIRAEAHRLIIRGTRPPPEPNCRASELNQLLALEIDHGSFERVLDLPQEIDPAQMTVDLRDGIFRIQLPLLA